MASVPKVSILLPVRDGEVTLAAALESLLQQTLEDIEVIVVDDGSTDATATLAEGFTARDPRVRVLRQEPRGIVPALNLAIEAARAPLVARMDADDISLPTRLEEQRAMLLGRDDLVGVASLVESFAGGVETEGWARYIRWLNGRQTTEEIARDLLVESPLAHPSVMLRTDALRVMGGYREFDGPEDYDLWLRLARVGGRFAKVPKVLLRWRDHGTRLTRTDGRYRPEAFLRCKVEHLLAGALAPRDRPIVIWGAGRDGGRFGRELIARGVSLLAYVDIDPRRIGRMRHDVPVIDAEALWAIEPKPLVLSLVGVEGARKLIRQRLDDRGFIEGDDYFCCA